MDIPVARRFKMDARNPPTPPPIIAIINGFTNFKLTPNTAGSVIPSRADKQEGYFRKF